MHTPGPWQIEGYVFVTSKTTGEHVASIGDAEARGDNARLIAQAPAMLEELREAVGWYDAQPREVRKPFYPAPGWYPAARAILRAIEGQS